MLVLAGKIAKNADQPLFRDSDFLQLLSNLKEHILIGIDFSSSQSSTGVRLLQELSAILTNQYRPKRIELITLRPDIKEYDINFAAWRAVKSETPFYSSFVRSMLTFPDALLEDVSIVIVCEAHITPEFGVHGPYMAQGGWLSPLDGPLHIYCGIELAYEAHRLIGSDLCLTFGDDYWLASRCAPALEAALARAVDLLPNRLPQISYLQQREQIDLTAVTTRGEFPSLFIPKTSVFRRGTIKLRHRFGRALYRLQKDFALARQNLYLIKPFLINRLGSK